MPKLAIVVSHPIQYYSPLFAVLAKEIELKVFYAFQPNAVQQGKEGFGQAFEWDVDLLSDYDYEFLDNVSKQPSSSNYNGCDTPTIGERIKAFGATHVVSFGWHLKMYRQTLNYCRKNKIPIAVRGDSQFNPQLAWWKKAIKKVYYPYFLNQYDAFLSVGERNRVFLKNYSIPEKRIIFSPHAVDQNFWKVDKRKVQKPIVFIWVAKFVSKKRPLDVIRAFKALLDQESSLKENIELRMVGSGELLKQAKDEAKEHSQIQFLGFKNQNELRIEYAEADCLVLSSDYGETWGLVVNEAFAAGIPAIVSDACGCGPDLINTITGKIYQLENMKELAYAINTMYNQLINVELSHSYEMALKEKNEIYSFERNIRSFQEFLDNF